MLAVEVLFPTSANWYSSHVVDALPDGRVVVATNQAATLLTASDRRVPGRAALQSRVSGVAISEELLAACCTDRVVHALRPSLETLGIHKEHHAEPSAIVNLKGLVISGDKRGALCLWTPPSKTVERLLPQKESVISLAVSTPRHCVAVGYHSGTVAVIALENHGVFCFRLRASVQSLSWLPDGTGLISACQDQSVQLWRLQPSGEEAEAEIQISPAAGPRDESKSWTSVCALSDSLILFSGSRGELFLWEESRSKPWRAAPVHTRPIFGLKAVGSDHVITTGMDRFIVLWTVSSGSPPQMKWRLCSLGGHVTALRADQNLACLGCGDNSLRVMDLMHREHRQHCWVAWKGLRTAVTSLASSGRGVWGYGLQDGSFGVLAINDSEGAGAAEPLCTRSHPGPVTEVCWMHLGGAGQAVPDTAPMSAVAEDAKAASGDSKGSKKSKAKKEEKKNWEECRSSIQGLGLVSLSAGHKVFYTPAQGTSVTLQLRPVGGVPAVPGAACVWPLEKLPKTGDEVLVVAATHQAGEATVETNSFQFFQIEGEELRCMAVMPAEGLEGGASCMSLQCEPTPATGKRSRCRLACGTSKGGLVVFQLNWPPNGSGTAQMVRSESVNISPLPEVVARNCHSKAVADVQWRPRSDKEHHLLSAGQDGLLKIWYFEPKDGASNAALTLRSAYASSGALLACWDPSDEDPVVLAGGREQLAFAWRPEASTETAPKEVIAEATRSTPSRGPRERKVQPGASVKQEKSSSLLSLTSAALYQQSSKARALELARVAADGDGELWFGEGLATGCGLRAKGMWSDASPGRRSRTLTEAIFCNCQSLADHWLTLEVAHKKDEDPHRARLLQFWAPDVDVADTTMDTAAQGAVAVSALWLWAALAEKPQEVLAELVATGEPLHHRTAAALALGRLEEAVSIYLTNELFAEALLLARLRLPFRHPLVLHVYRSWAQDLLRRQRHDQAALCFLATKEFGRALACLEDWLSSSNALGRRLGPNPLRMAGAFAAACCAQRLVKAEKLRDAESGEDGDCDTTLAFDHRSWWGFPELRAAVQAWKRYMVEALFTGDASAALRIARVGPLHRDLSPGERFLRGVFSGYASGMAWWLQLGEEGDWSEAECPLAAFVGTGASIALGVSEDIDWDFEWRALTWLPAWTSEEEFLLTATVELGRACEAWASGGRNAEAPRTHLHKAINALMKGAKAQSTPESLEGLQQITLPLKRLAALLRSDARGSLCVTKTVELMLQQMRDLGEGSAAKDEEDALEGGDSWEPLGRVLFGRPNTKLAEIFCLGREYQRLRWNASRKAISDEEMPLSALEELQELVPKLPLDLVPDAWVVSEQLQQAVLAAASSCGLKGVASGMLQEDEDDSSPEAMIAKCVRRLSALHRSCGVPGLVPLAVSGWFSEWLATAPEELPEDDVEEDLLEGPAAITSELLEQLAELLPQCWKTEDSSDHSVAPELLSLEAFEHLKWSSRLSLAKQISSACHGAAALLRELEAPEKKEPSGCGPRAVRSSMLDRTP
ncbi:unnamed protein product [Durusdinium trenchii]|uniref:Gem-associated protein 5 TPR domain-containing protein n=1 Tax=Durusdinium trenchii TaxID=1381693 RepID=A0ABP0IRH9_9DINO